MSKTSCTNLKPMPMEKVGLGQGIRDYQNFQSEFPRPSTILLPIPKRAKLLTLLKWALKNIVNGITRTLLRIFSPILKLLLHITLLFMVFTWTAIQYPIKVASILGIWKSTT